MVQHDPYIKKEENDIVYYCPECKESLGRMFQIEFTDEDGKKFRVNMGSKALKK